MTGNTVSDRDLELLSAYLDGELDDRDRADLENRLADSATLRDTLAELRATVELVRALPQLKAPRSFALDPAVYGGRAPWWKRTLTTGTMLQLSGALGSAASVTLIVAALLLNSADTQNRRASQPAPVSLPTEVGYISESAQPPEAESRLQPTATAVAPTASAPPVAEMAQSEEDSAAAVEGEVDADTAGAPAYAEMAPPPGAADTFGAAPAAPLAAGQSAPAEESAPKETTAANAAGDEQAAAPMLQADQAEQPGPPSTTIMIAPAGTATAAEPSPTATPPPTAVVQERPPADDAAREASAAAEDSGQDDERGYAWLAILGAILFPASIAVFLFGRRKARHA